MPARTNEFQKLVKIINQSLIPAGAKVTESAMLYDRVSEKEREIDILVESSVLNCNIKIGIECTEISRPLDVLKLESFKEKHKNVGINQTIIVAKNGFTKSAKNYAEKNNIKLLTFNHARKENWLKRFEKFQSLFLYARNYTFNSAELLFKEQPDDKFEFNTSVLVSSSGGWVSLVDFSKELFLSSNISKIACKELIENEKKGENPWLKLGFSLNENFSFKDTAGIIVKPFEIAIIMDYKSNYKNLNANQVEYDGKNIVVGMNYDNKNRDFVSVSIIDSPEGYKANLEVSGNIFPNQ
jgi:hypothetical protein